MEQFCFVVKLHGTSVCVLWISVSICTFSIVFLFLRSDSCLTFKAVLCSDWLNSACLCLFLFHQGRRWSSLTFSVWYWLLALDWLILYCPGDSKDLMFQNSSETLKFLKLLFLLVQPINWGGCLIIFVCLCVLTECLGLNLKLVAKNCAGGNGAPYHVPLCFKT